jgi:hypothetical protein
MARGAVTTPQQGFMYFEAAGDISQMIAQEKSLKC